MKTSQVASRIYQAAKQAATGAWCWRTEWQKAMKAAAHQLSIAIRNARMFSKALAESLGNLKKTADAYKIDTVNDSDYVNLNKIYCYLKLVKRMSHHEAAYRSIAALYIGGIVAYSSNPRKHIDERINSDYGQRIIAKADEMLMI